MRTMNSRLLYSSSKRRYCTARLYKFARGSLRGRATGARVARRAAAVDSALSIALTDAGCWHTSERED